MTQSITVVMVTYNEERMLAESLDSVRALADEIVVGDLGSKDASRSIALAHGAKVVDLPHAEAVEMVRPGLVARASGDWILLLDPDEVVSPRLCVSLRQLMEANDHDVAELTFLTYMMGRQLRGTGWSPARERHVRFFRRGRVELRSEVHSPPRAKHGARLASLGPEAGCVHHFNYVSWEQFITKMNRYTSLEASDRFASGASASVWGLVRELALEVAGRGVLDRSWRDGWRGAALLMLMLAYRTLVFAKHRLLVSVGTQADVVDSDRRRAQGIAGLPRE